MSSLLLIIFFGAALGNVVRGVPLDASGYFFEPLWTNFRLGEQTGILDWYTILIGVTSLFALTQHGAAWLLLKTSGAVQLKSRAVARRAWWGVVALTIVVTWFTFRIEQISTSFAAHPWGYVLLPAIAVAGLVALRWFLTGADNVRRELEAFLASCAYLLGMLTSVVFGLYPYVLPASTNPAYSLSIDNAKAGAYGLRIGLVWWFIGIGLAIVYFAIVYRHFQGGER